MVKEITRHCSDWWPLFLHFTQWNQGVFGNKYQGTHEVLQLEIVLIFRPMVWLLIQYHWRDVQNFNNTKIL
jgi:hypothetical protein